MAVRRTDGRGLSRPCGASSPKGRSYLFLVEFVNGFHQSVQGILDRGIFQLGTGCGRISAAAAFAGAALGIKPAISVREGLVVNVGKARGTRQCQALLDQLSKESGEIDWSRPVATLFSASADALEQFLAEYPEYNAPRYGMGCTIGTHIGPGAYGMAFFEK